MHSEQVQSHQNTPSRVEILLTSLRSARLALNQAVVDCSELARRNAHLRHTLDAMFTDQDSSDQSDAENNERPRLPSTHAYWNRLHRNALTESGDESDHSWPSSDDRRNGPQTEAKAKANSSQAAPEPKARPSHSEISNDPVFHRAERRLAGIYTDTEEENGSDPDEPHPNVYANSWYPDP